MRNIKKKKAEKKSKKSSNKNDCTEERELAAMQVESLTERSFTTIVVNRYCSRTDGQVRGPIAFRRAVRFNISVTGESKLRSI